MQTIKPTLLEPRQLPPKLLTWIEIYNTSGLYKVYEADVEWEDDDYQHLRIIMLGSGIKFIYNKSNGDLTTFGNLIPAHRDKKYVKCENENVYMDVR